MPRSPHIPTKLSPSAEIELERLMRLCRRLKLSRSKVAKVKRIVRIIFYAAGEKETTGDE